MKMVHLALLALLSFFPLVVKANSPQKYKVSYKVYQKLPESVGKFKFYVNGVAGPGFGGGPKNVESPERPIDLTFVDTVNDTNHFLITLPSPASIDKSQRKFFLVELDKLKIAVNVTIFLKKSTPVGSTAAISKSAVSTILYKIELVEANS